MSEQIKEVTRSRHGVYRPYMALLNAAQIKRMTGDNKGAKVLRQQAQHMPSRDPFDPNFRRLWYVRYADDWLLGFSGPRGEAEEVKQRCNSPLRTHPAFIRRNDLLSQIQ